MTSASQSGIHTENSHLSWPSRAFLEFGQLCEEIASEINHSGWEFQALCYNSVLQLLRNSHPNFSFMSTIELSLLL